MKLEFTAEMIANMVQGTVEGDPKTTVNDFAKIEEGRPGCISFLANPKYAHYLYETKSSIVLVNRDFQLEGKTEATLIRVDNAYETIAKLLSAYESMKPKRSGIDPLAYVAPTAKIGKDVFMAPFSAVGDNAVIGDGAQLHPHATVGANAVIGDNTIMYSNSVVYHDCKVGKRCILHAGSVIGADGFGFAPTENGYEKIPQIGIVTIEDDVEVGANTCIDRSTMGSTNVRKGVKLDNLVQVAHNCEIGENTVMSAQAGMAGSTKIGAWCMVGGQAGFSGHIHVADKTFVGAQCGVISNTKGNGESLIGSPAVNPKMYFKARAIDAKLPDMYREVYALRRELDALKAQIEK